MRTHLSLALSRSRLYLRFLLVAGFLLAAACSTLHADLVYLKDGYTIVGKVKRESEVIGEGGTVVSSPKLNGFFMVDDGPRRIVFSQKQVADLDKKDVDRERGLIVLQRRIPRLDHFKVPAGRYLDIGPWSDKWDRTLTLQVGPSPNSTREISQHLSVLTPHYARIDARRYNWDGHYLTQELKPDEIRDLLYKHPDLKLKRDSSDAAKRLRVAQFFAQAEMYDPALAELDTLERALPAEKQKAEAVRNSIRRALRGRLMDEIEEAHKAGRHQWAQEQLKSFPTQETDDRLLVRVRTLQATYETLNDNIAQAQRFLDELPGQIKDPEFQTVLTEAVTVMSAELNPDTIGRLDAFLGMAQQAARERQQQRTPSQSAEQLGALAVSGWLLGNAAAENRVQTAIRLWGGRQFVLRYQRTHDANERKRMRQYYSKKGDVAYDELARLISSLPPPEPFQAVAVQNGPWTLGLLPFAPAALSWALFAMQNSLPGAAFELQAVLPWSIRTGAAYQLQLPPEYHPGRNYPVLIVLRQVGEKAQEALGHWGPLAARHGYILVVPDWDRGLKLGYQYTNDEHRAVTEVVRDLRQRFQVDSDRVFLAGWGEGGNMAYDVGLSHPDQFAGVVTMDGRPHHFSVAYWPNAMYLPFYVIDGDLDGEMTGKANRHQFQNWASPGHNYPALYVQYKGRGSEWFGAELPYLFDWMGRKKRAPGFPDLGRGGTGFGGEAFQSLRPTDNHFYWVELEGLEDRHTNEARGWKSGIAPASVQARIGEGNQINLHGTGFHRAILWFRPGMIDFDKPVKLYVNGQQTFAPRKVVPNLETLLEEFYLQGDRQRVFLARLEVPL
jgi:Esterase PHB depolymerase